MKAVPPTTKQRINRFILGVLHFIFRFMYLTASIVSLFGLISCVVSIIRCHWTDALIFIAISYVSAGVALYSAERG